MYPFLTKYGQTLAFGLGLLMTVVFLLIVIPNSGEVADPANPGKFNYDTKIFNFGLVGSILLTAAAIIFMVVFGVFQMFSDLKRSRKGLIGLFGLVVICLICYFTADVSKSASVQEAISKFEEANKTTLSDNNFRLISGSIVISGVLLGAAALAFLVSEVRNFFK